VYEHNSRLKYHDGRQKGRKEGKKKGREKRRKEGKKEGRRKEGKKEGKGKPSDHSAHLFGASLEPVFECSLTELAAREDEVVLVLAADDGLGVGAH
jgi:hypothetical protein